MLLQRIKQLATNMHKELQSIRHHLHAHPELSYKEFETSAFVQAYLKKLDIPFEVKAETGVIGLIKGKNPNSRIIALRADMDALPIQEENNIPYKSTKPNIMHACGHDVHTTCLLGAANILQQTATEWEGTIKLIFQPGEEKNPGGASLLIKENVLENPRPQGIVALHVNPQLEIGKLSFRKGMAMASADEIYITIKGKGGHAAAPHFTVDTVLAASQLIVSLQQIISRNCNPFSPSVLSICAIHGGNSTNVIPSEVKLMGTFRAMDETWRFKAHELIKKQTMELVHAMGATADVHIDVGYPVLFNNEQLTDTAWQLAKDYMGDNYVEETEMRMGAEDFSYYTHQIPGCFFRLGTANAKKQITSGVHTSTFNIDEDALPIGAGIMAWIGASLIVDKLKG